jgi:hypothetical protein
MIFHDLSKNLIDKGIILNLRYEDENKSNFHFFVGKGNFLKEYSILDKIQDDKYYDIFREAEVNLDLLNLIVIEYPECPFLDLQSFLKQPKNVIDLYPEYPKQVKKIISIYKEDLDQIYKENLLDIETNDDEKVHDLLTLRFYPKQIKKQKNIKEKIRKDILNKFFTCYDPNLINRDEILKFEKDKTAPSFIPGLKKFGINKINEDIEDEIFINALKRQWFALMIGYKEETINNLKKSDISFMTDKEKKEFQKEVEEFSSVLDSIEISCMDHLKTPRQIATYWHPFLQPKPCFAYES